MTSVIRNRSGRLLGICAMLLLLALGLIAVSLRAGALTIPFNEVVDGLLSPFSGPAESLHSLRYHTLWSVRLPRVVMAMLVGAVLAACGAVLQGLFGNPLADPGILGISAGASLGSLLAVVSGAAIAGAWTLPVGAFVGALGVMLLIYRLAKPDGATAGSVRLLLVGIATSAAVSALMGWLSWFATAQQRQQLAFFSFGTLSVADWGVVLLVLPLAVIGTGFLIWRAPLLDLLVTGERQAEHMGVNVARLRKELIVMTSLLVAAGVAFAGPIAFVGLIVPHLCRLLMGPAHRLLVALSSVCGALLLLAADLLSRTVVAPAEMSIGILTGTIGGPFFLWLVWRSRELR
ncbi:MAG: FecCD family ABC transporter permease [Scandinavium sp.]|uniref:FecCD family ABC transporter permease n=1 Tax=Scandinavium sp. TaxID=2830653 RepID=UPI003F2E65BD